MKHRLISIFDKLLLRKRASIERVIDQLKNISQIEHSRQRSVANCFVNLVAGLIAYTYREKKPSLNLAAVECRNTDGVAGLSNPTMRRARQNLAH